MKSSTAFLFFSFAAYVCAQCTTFSETVDGQTFTNECTRSFVELYWGYILRYGPIPHLLRVCTTLGNLRVSTGLKMFAQGFGLTSKLEA
ncbi:hypothetical protein EDD16DRAFT_1586326 [Pisolithus croceorrhizus]|nr:hypothetical protein EV401DRAFT_1977329 [Pisolithus croceorrhizus]KAI6117849.1 hypothetical protein EDD16DRAFT_1586326 [Pisolithus croceorrhizus]KAI6163315.1 hypothetical protein EDD17DRAFT_1569080 [Pisolithus thermaeus]